MERVIEREKIARERERDKREGERGLNRVIPQVKK